MDVMTAHRAANYTTTPVATVPIVDAVARRHFVLFVLTKIKLPSTEMGISL